jgi:2-C-methyl-D-erythritol 2,4-cyclodiphosphate synthase
MNRTSRTILFWMFVLMLAVVLWKMASTSEPSARVRGLSYSEFMQALEKPLVQNVVISLSRESAEVQGSLADSTEKFIVIIPRENLQHVTQMLTEKDIRFDFTERARNDWLTVVLNVAPFVLLVAFWVFLMRNMRGGVKALRLRARSGVAYDLHCLEPGRTLILGGTVVPFDKGPVGHSDGDVLSHAICDALLGAAGLGDIGTHFPDTDPQWKGASSLLFLERARKLIAEKGLAISHVDAVVIAEKPKLGPHFPAMRKKLSETLGISEEQINLKAKTNEGVDAIGRGEAIACHAVATLA